LAVLTERFGAKRPRRCPSRLKNKVVHEEENDEEDGSLLGRGEEEDSEDNDDDASESINDSTCTWESDLSLDSFEEDFAEDLILARQVEDYSA
jgi:hypothetical protein